MLVVVDDLVDGACVQYRQSRATSGDAVQVVGEGTAADLSIIVFERRILSIGILAVHPFHCLPWPMLIVFSR